MSLNYYDLKDGSLIVELKPNLLNKLSIGKHTLTVVFDDGEAKSYFYITNENPKYTLPETGIE